MKKQTKKWVNSSLALSLLATGLVAGGGITAEASSISSKTTIANERQAMYFVEKAELSKVVSDIQFAKTYVSSLKLTPVKKSLESRLIMLERKVQAEIKQAHMLMSKAESSKLPQDIYLAKKYSSVVKDPVERSKMKTRLSFLEKILTQIATESVFQAEKSNLKADIDKARYEVGVMDVSLAKTNLTNRLNNLEAKVRSIQNQAEYHVSLLEKTVTEKTVNQMYLADVKKYTSMVAEPTIHQKLSMRILTVEKEIHLQTRALHLVSVAEKTKDLHDVQIANKAVSQLKNGLIKSQLQNRLDRIKVSIIPAPIQSPIIVKPGDPTIYKR